MMDEKGYIQFTCLWAPGPPPLTAAVPRLLQCRNRLFSLGLIGVYPTGIGYGNVSTRSHPPGQFIITGTATGHIPQLTPEHLTLVCDYDVDANRLACIGPLQASSESLSHAAVYEACPVAQAVIHVHNGPLWQALREHAPATDPLAEAGTPAMARAITHLLRRYPSLQLFAMAGHTDGVMVWGEDFQQAEQILLAEFAKRDPDRPTAD